MEKRDHLVSSVLLLEASKNAWLNCLGLFCSLEQMCNEWVRSVYFMKRRVVAPTAGEQQIKRGESWRWRSS